MALRRAWLAYHRRIEAAMVEAGFDDGAVPDGRVLRLCLEPSGTTISTIGRALGITRQGAGKLVGSLRDRGYLEVRPSASSGREVSVTATAKARDYLALRRQAASRVEDEVRAELGADGYAQLRALLQVLGGTEESDSLRGPPDLGDRGGSTSGCDPGAGGGASRRRGGSSLEAPELHHRFGQLRTLVLLQEVAPAGDGHVGSACGPGDPGLQDPVGARGDRGRRRRRR